jgi:hypothetical protein
MNKSRKQCEMEGKVYAFLKNNPLSTAEEIYKATGCGVIGLTYITHRRYNGQVCWRLNHRKLKAHGLE